MTRAETTSRHPHPLLGAALAALTAGCVSVTTVLPPAAPPRQAPAEPTHSLRPVPTAQSLTEGADDPFVAAAAAAALATAHEQAVPAAQWVSEFPPAIGEALGRIRIPVIGVDEPMIEGVGKAQLDRSPGHMPRTAMPGQFGNAAIAGHRTTFGAPFHDLDLLEPGDEIHVDTGIGTHTYAVVSTEIVLPTAMWTVQHRAGGWLTLIACHPKGSARQRIIVFTGLVAGPNFDAVAAAYPGPYLPPQDPGTAVTRRHHRQTHAVVRYI